MAVIFGFSILRGTNPQILWLKGTTSTPIICIGESPPRSSTTQEPYYSKNETQINELNKLTLLPMCGFIAQLVEHCTSVAEVMGSNPIEALIFSGLFFPVA